jgi:hypothetical protein
MKKLIFLLSSLLMLFMYTCTNDEGIIPGSGGDADLKCTHSHGAVITVNPTGEDDTQILTDAFEEAKAAGPGSVVKLAEGTFRIGFIEVRDFNGYFVGAGREKTRVQNLDIMPSCVSFFEDDMFPMLLSFVGGDVHVSRMTFATTDGPVTPDDLWYGFLSVLVGFCDYSGMYIPKNKYIKAVIEDVDFIGGYYGGTNAAFGTDHNVSMAIFAGAKQNVISSYSHIDITIKHCGFYHVATGPDAFGLDDNSTLVIEDITSRNAFYSMFVAGYLGLKAHIHNNRFYEAPVGSIIDNWDYDIMPEATMKKRPEVYISGNYFQGLDGMTTLTMIDTRRVQYPDEGFPQLFEVQGNFFDANGDVNTVLLLNTLSTKIWNNKFSGNAENGVFIDGNDQAEVFAENAQLIGNNFFGGRYSNAAVYLGPWTKNCKVIGVGSDKVTDLGTGNKVIGVNANKNGKHTLEMNPHFRSILELRMRQHNTQTR